MTIMTCVTPESIRKSCDVSCQTYFFTVYLFSFFSWVFWFSLLRTELKGKKQDLIEMQHWTFALFCQFCVQTSNVLDFPSVEMSSKNGFVWKFILLCCQNVPPISSFMFLWFLKYPAFFMKIAIVAVKKGKCLCGQSEVSYASKAEANCYTVEPSLWMGGGRWNSSCIFDDSMARPPTFKIVTKIKLSMRWIQSCSIIFQTPVEKKSFRQIIPALPSMIWTKRPIQRFKYGQHSLFSDHPPVDWPLGTSSHFWRRKNIFL